MGQDDEEQQQQEDDDDDDDDEASYILSGLQVVISKCWKPRVQGLIQPQRKMDTYGHY